MKQHRRPNRARPIWLAMAMAAWSAVAAGQDAGNRVELIRSSRTRPEAAVRAEGFRLATGLGTVFLGDGILVPAGPATGLPTEWVFIGSGTAHLEPPDGVERSQLELFTGDPFLDEEFDRAVFVVALDAASDALSRLPPAAGDRRIASAAALYEEWQASPERRLLGVDARLLRDLLEDSLGRGFFCGYFSGLRLGRFLWVVDPLAEEQVTVGQFVPADLSGRDRRRAERHIEREQRRGKLIGLVADDLGIWDTWVSACLRAPDGEATPGSTGVEPRRYEIAVTLRGKRLELEGTARLELEVLVDGLRAVTLDVGRDLTTTGVRDGGGHPLDFVHSAGELTVVLDQPWRAGTVQTLEVSYRGSPIERVASGAYIQRSPLGWYPHAGQVDRAAYDVTVRWPKRYDLLGSGTVVEQGAGEDGSRWQRRVLDVRSLGFSFEVGDFDTAAGRVGRVNVTVAVDRVGRKVSDQLAAEILAAVEGPLAYYESVFGPYPLDELVVVSSPRGFSQGLLGFVTLSTAGVVDWDVWGALLGFEDRRLLIAHELAHQWWGNQVGWRSYRDQWISEAMASYAALLYERNRMAALGEPRLGLGPTSGWQSVLGRVTNDGRPVESLGPVTLGVRLNSSLSSEAYEAIVYKKGAVVLDMLARLYGEDVFLEMLREVVGAASGRIISTDDFLTLLERLGGVDLQWFRSQYVLGTGLPEIYYDYRIESIDGARWAIDGEARQQATYVFRYRVVEGSDGGLDVIREAEPRLDISGSVLVVPFQIGLAAEAEGGGDVAAGPLRRLLTGRLVLSGSSSPFRLELDERPEIFWLDRGGEVFGRFFAEARWPRRAALERGLALAARGELELAEDEWLAAFAMEVATVDEHLLGVEVDLEAAARSVDTSLHLALARLYLTEDQLEGAAERIERARARMGRDDRWRFDSELAALEARLAIQSGRPDEAARQLRRSIGRGREGLSAETAALLAVASHLAGRPHDFEASCREALERGVDLGPLECPGP
jgi:hypothetical protein